MGKNPAFQFYPGDWQRDLEEHSLEIGGAWILICCSLWWTEGKATKPIEQWAKILGETRKKTEKIIKYLLKNGIADGDEKSGIFTIISRRMVRDINISIIRKEAGQKGGHPLLTKQYNQPGFLYVMHRLSDGFLKIGVSNNPTQRLYKIRFQHPGDTIEVSRTYRVEDMGKIENELHNYFKQYSQGEWFNISVEYFENELKLLGILLKEDIKQDGNQNPTPSSSSSISSSLKENTTTRSEPFFKCDYFSVANEDADEYCKCYNITEDILRSELMKMKLWLKSNPKNQKKNYERFINNWVARQFGKNKGWKGKDANTKSRELDDYFDKTFKGTVQK